MIGPAVEADLDAIVALESDGFDDGRWSRASWADALASGRVRVLVARAGDEVVGVAGLSHVAGLADHDRDATPPPPHPRAPRPPLARPFLSCPPCPGPPPSLLALPSPPAPASLLSERLGFVPVGRRPGYYGPGRDALVMELNRAGGGQT